MASGVRTYNTIEKIQERKEELLSELHASSDTIGNLWDEISKESKPTSKGEMITSIISKSITAFDAFLLARKLVTQYGHIFKVKRKK